MRPSDALAAHRRAIRDIVTRHRAGNARVFGSIVHDADAEGSDLDLLVDPTPRTTLFDLAGIQGELQELLGVPVDVVTPRALPARFRERVLAEAMPL